MRDEVVVEGRLLEWGNSYGIRIRAADVDELGLQPGQEVSVRLSPETDRVDVSDVPTFQGGRPDVSMRHDEILGEALHEDHASRGD